MLNLTFSELFFIDFSLINNIILKNEICNNNLVQMTQLAHIKTWLQNIFGKKKKSNGKNRDYFLPSVDDEIENGPAVHAREKHPWQSWERILLKSNSPVHAS